MLRGSLNLHRKMAPVKHQPSRSPIRPLFATFGLALYGAMVALVTLTPQPVDQGFQRGITTLIAALHRRGVPEWFGYTELEFSMNIVMFVPLGFFVTLVLTARWQWLALILLPMMSAGIELTQLFFLSGRYATVPDVVANSLGGWIGVLCAVILRALVHARDRSLLRVM